MTVPTKDDIFRWIISILLSLIAFMAAQIWSNQTDIGCRVRTVELNQARIMERLGILDVAQSVVKKP